MQNFLKITNANMYGKTKCENLAEKITGERVFDAINFSSY